MIAIYITLNDAAEARTIGNELLEKNFANCVNFFPITCIYKYKGEVTEEPETVLIVKTKEDYYDRVLGVVKSHINYDNFVGALKVEHINDDFTRWLDDIVK